MKKRTLWYVFLLLLTIFVITSIGVSAQGNKNESDDKGGQSIDRFTSYKEMVTFLERTDRRSEHISLEVYGQSVKKRNLYLMKFGDNPVNPTILFLTQQHGNEAITTESALQLIRKLSSNDSEIKTWSKKVNVLIAPRLNPDGAEGDVNWDTSHFIGGGLQTRNNANGIDLNRTHNSLSQPETRAFHEQVLQKYDIDYLIDFHTQKANYVTNGELVTGALLYPKNPKIEEHILKGSKQLGAVVYEALASKGYTNLAKYGSNTTRTSNARNNLAVQYNISTLLIEMRGMTDSPNECSILGQESNGYLIQQGVIAMKSAIESLVDESIKDADVTFWDRLPPQFEEECSQGDQEVGE